MHSECEPIAKMITTAWFVLPPVQEYYFKAKNITYQSLPLYRKDCISPSSIPSLDLVYPKFNAKIFIPRELDGSMGSTVFEATHRNQKAVIYWHMDGNFLQTTKNQHRLAFIPSPGSHILTLMDDRGEVVERPFSVISK